MLLLNECFPSVQSKEENARVSFLHISRVVWKANPGELAEVPKLSAMMLECVSISSSCECLCVGGYVDIAAGGSL